jgi:hypothetical protein
VLDIAFRWFVYSVRANSNFSTVRKDRAGVKYSQIKFTPKSSLKQVASFKQKFSHLRRVIEVSIIATKRSLQQKNTKLCYKFYDANFVEKAIVNFVVYQKIKARHSDCLSTHC